MGRLIWLGMLACVLLVVGCGSSGGDVAPAGGVEATPALSDDAAPVSAVEVSEAEVTVRIERVIDGDSLEAVVDDEVVETRLLGINAPELYTLAGEESCTGQAAKAHLEQLLDGTEPGWLPNGTDRFGRQLADLELDGQRVTDAMVEAGWALGLWSSDRPLTPLMIEAATAERGMWGSVCGPPSAGGLVISDHQMNSPGDDRESLDEEWVEITNDGSASADLTGWTIKDETTSNRFLLDGVVLDPGASVRVRTGSGSAGVDDLYLGEEFPVWSNNGETVLLLDPDGVLAAYAFAS